MYDTSTLLRIAGRTTTPDPETRARHMLEDQVIAAAGAYLAAFRQQYPMLARNAQYVRDLVQAVVTEAADCALDLELGTAGA